LNRSDRIRFAFLCDYQRDDFKELSKLAPTQDLWEDWPAIAALPLTLTSAPPDHQLEPHAGPVENVPSHSAAYRLSEAHGRKSDPSSVRKSDASALARSRRVGDKWLLLSDSPATENDWEIYPRGSDLSETGLRVVLDGAPLSSVCRYDFIARLALAPGRHTVRIEGLDRKAWLRVLDIKLPFTQTGFLLKEPLLPGATELSFSVS
jgi:hypothetical protein